MFSRNSTAGKSIFCVFWDAFNVNATKALPELLSQIVNRDWRSENQEEIPTMFVWFNFISFHEALSSFCCVSGRYIEGVGNGLGANHPYTIAHTHTHAHTYTYNTNTITHRGAVFENTRHRTDVQRGIRGCWTRSSGPNTATWRKAHLSLTNMCGGQPTHLSWCVL